MNQRQQEPNRSHNSSATSVAATTTTVVDSYLDSHLEDDDRMVTLEPFPVEVIRSANRVRTTAARLVDGVVQVRIPAWMSPEEEHRAVTDLVDRMTKQQRCDHLPLAPRARSLAKKFGLPQPSSIQWSQRQTAIWGSCMHHSGNIRISSRLAEVPPWVLDYVIIHELAHLVEAKHTPAFYDLVSRYPKAERAEGYLLALRDLAAASPRHR